MTILKKIREQWFFVLIAILGIAFRLIPLKQYQFSHDELSALSRTVYNGFSEELSHGVMLGDTHPALIQLFLFYWVKLFGYNEIAIKLPFLLCGIASIYMIYRFCKLFFGVKTAIASSSIVSLSFIFLVYSSYARMYISGILFCLLLLYAVYKILFSEEVRIKHYVLFACSCLLAAYNHHMSCLFAALVAGLALCYIPKERLKKYLLFCGLAILFYLPHLPVTLYQFSIGGIGASAGGWLTPPRNTEIWYFVKALFGCGMSGKFILALLVIVLLVSVLKLRPISKKQSFLFWIFTANYLIIHLYSVFKNPILQYSVLLFCGLCLIVLLCSFTELLSMKQAYAFSTLLVVLLCYQAVVKKQVFSKVHVQEFESQVKTTLDFQQKYGKDKVSSIFKTEAFFVYAYEKKYHTVLDHLSLKDSVLLRPDLLRNYLAKLNASYIVLGGVGAEDIALVKEYFPYLVLHEEAYFRNTLVFSKQDAHYQDASLIKEMELTNSDIDLYINTSKLLSFKDDSMRFDVQKEDDEFPFNLSLPLQKGDFKLGQFVLAELSYSTAKKEDIEKERLCMAVAEKGKDAVFFKTSNFSDYYDSTKAMQTLYLEYFVGVDNSAWAGKQMNLNPFIWKAKGTTYSIRRIKLRQYAYNPTKWILWD